MFNLEGLIPKLCQVGHEIGEDDRALRLRSAGLQALASMVYIIIIYVPDYIILFYNIHYIFLWLF